MSNKSFLKGAVILGIAGMIVKIMGAFFRIPLGNIIGATGFGYYQAAYPIYVLLLTVSTAGIPTAISKLVSEKNAVGDRHGAFKVFKVSFILLFITGIITSSILFFGAKIIVNLIKSPGAYYSMVAIAPALLFVPVMSAFRGFFQGRQDMTPTAVSQVMEQFARVVVGLSLAILLLDRGLEISAAGASFGAAAGGIMGAVTIIIIYFRRRSSILCELKGAPAHKQDSWGKIIYRLLTIAVPITVGAAIIPTMNMIDVAIVVRRLQTIGFTYEQANDMYGQLTGMAMTIINLPQILTVALAMSLVPAISEANQRRDRLQIQNTIQTGTRVALLIGLPAAAGLVALSKPIMLLLYPLKPESAASAAAPLAVLAVGVIFLTLVQTFTGILQGLGRPTVPVCNLFIGAVVKVILTYFLTGIPSINIKGAAFGTVMAYGVAAVLNFLAVRRLTKTKFDVVQFVIKPLIAITSMSVAVLLIYSQFVDILGNRTTAVTAIGIGALIYGFMLLATGGITAADFDLMPGGRKLVKLLRIFGLLRK
ncbi:stage V sporulation protein B [Geosporobacter subterraneus DSM 17957]|uniref:Stage V sporulation protein B n=1 Tax=Geosporobacter subterraneus DSM 17957 TaxID=1121919 RepID=A0A1M6FG23_9FIRM|nr:polysaccharide biosynthesis protein [Geosporobacter subterraneus]SHI96606.1 stage V sporulation protein B [Geosporobacter subterraneus DSM 17957]